MKSFGDYLYKDVAVVCKDGEIFKGQVTSFGCDVQGLEEYGREEEHICVYTGDAEYVLFDSEIEKVVEI